MQDISEGPAPINVLATANADDLVNPWAALPNATDEQKRVTVPAIVSNTEGRIQSVEVRLVLDEDETTLKPGAVIQISGHFS